MFDSLVILRYKYIRYVLCTYIGSEYLGNIIYFTSLQCGTKCDMPILFNLQKDNRLQFRGGRPSSAMGLGSMLCLLFIQDIVYIEC